MLVLTSTPDGCIHGEFNFFIDALKFVLLKGDVEVQGPRMEARVIEQLRRVRIGDVHPPPYEAVSADSGRHSAHATPPSLSTSNPTRTRVSVSANANHEDCRHHPSVTSSGRLQIL